MKKATFAGGCFWCMEPPFKQLPGVLSVVSGYMGGHTENPTYEAVCSGKTGHAEVIEVSYNPEEVSYDELLELFWCNIDPTTVNQQFVDVGTQYRTGIFYYDEEQRRAAEASKEALEKSGRFQKKIVTEIVPASAFYPAEDYHQDYYRKNSLRYRFYRERSGRDAFLARAWAIDKKS